MEGLQKFRAYAKINLCLSVGAPAAEGPKAGFHPIATWMQAVDLYDEVAISRLADGQKSTYSVRWADDALCPTPIDWPLEKDLGVRAHKALESTGLKSGGLPVSMEIVKRIPVGGGLGGGSSDAATVFQGLHRVFGTELPEERLRELSMALGSDVVFFADEQAEDDRPRAALVGGFGDKIRRVEGVKGEVVLVIPPYGCPTGPVYKAFDELLVARQALEAAERAAKGNTGREKQSGPKDSLVESRWKKMARSGRIDGDLLFNDLALAAFKVEPRLGRLVTALSNATREQAHVTGSGSCIFIPSTADRVGRLLERVQKLLASSDEFAGVKAVATRLL